MKPWTWLFVTIGIAAGLTLIASGAAAAGVPVVGGGNVTLADIAGTNTVVTVVLRSGGSDPNQNVLSVHDGHFSVVDQKGERSHYSFGQVREVRVQGDLIRVEEPSFLKRPDRQAGLTGQQKKVVLRALSRAQEVFGASSPNQPLKMDAAEIIMVGGEEDAVKKARSYLESLVTGNDLATAVAAAQRLFLAGDSELAATVVQPGMSSGDRRVSGAASELAGLVNVQDEEIRYALFRLFQDRMADFSVPASHALARLGDRSAIPGLVDMLREKNEEKVMAAVFGLSMLGGDDVIAKVKDQLGQLEGRSKYYGVRILHACGDPEGTAMLRDYLDSATLKYETALVLAPDGDIRAMQVLRDFLGERFERTEEMYIRRARAVAGLVEGGELAHLGALQDLLRSDLPAVVASVYDIIGGLGKTSLIPLIRPGIESPDAMSVLAACRATVELAFPEYRERRSVANSTAVQW
jgi:HEAT repeat protein